MGKVNVSVKDSSYDILIGRDNLSEIVSFIEGYSNILVISNTTVGALYGEKLVALLEEKTNNIYYYEMNDGEEHKNIESSFAIYDYMLENDFDRKSLIITLGGGVVCDLGGYIASTYMRGIDFIQVPTSLLAQVDASIGGKVAVNHSKAKNLIGSFYQPKLVLINVEFLHTLNQKEFKAGLGEIIKHSFLVDNGYYEFLIENSKKIKEFCGDTLIEVIEKSCLIKRDVVTRDEREEGVRASLNLGHTWGHALETATEYRGFSHGEAVAKGMIFELELGKLLGLTPNHLIEKATNIFDVFDIPSKPILLEGSRLISLMKKDKKNVNGKIKFVIIKEMGEFVLLDIDEKKILEINSTFKNNFIKGSIDIGTNSCRLFIAEINNHKGKDRIITKFKKELSITQIGEDVDKNRYLLPSAMERTIDVLKKYKSTLIGYGATKVNLYATSAVRDAENRDEFIERVKKETDLVVSCITGDKEATLSFKGAIKSLDSHEQVILIDIGGGSTEVIKGNSSTTEFLKSFNVGAVRITEKFFKDENYTAETLERARSWATNLLEEIHTFSDSNFKLVGVAGTVTTHVSVEKKLYLYDPEVVHQYKLNRKTILENINYFLSLSLEERKKVVGLHPKRANVIIGGSIILLTIMDLLNKKEIIVSDEDILEGIMED